MLREKQSPTPPPRPTLIRPQDLQAAARPDAVGGIVGVYLSIPLVAALRVVWRRLPSLKNADVS